MSPNAPSYFTFSDYLFKVVLIDSSYHLLFTNIEKSRTLRTRSNSSNKMFKGRLSSLRRSFTSPEADSSSNETKEESGRSSFFDEEPLPEVSFHGYAATTKHRLLTPEISGEVRNQMPTRIQLYPDWQLLYSLEQDGASLHSLYGKVAPDAKNPGRVGYVLLIEDRKGGIFGAYTNEPFRPTERKRYYGNGECFLWKIEKAATINIGNAKASCSRSSDHHWRFRSYPFTGLNEFVIYCTSEFLSMGAGNGHYGLWCDSSLINGVSDPSLTFGNDVLSREGNKFHIVNLEVWRVG